MSEEGTTAPPSPVPRDVLGLTAAVLGAMLFSTKPIFIKLAYAEGINAETLLALRMALAVPVYLVVGGLAMQRRMAAGSLPSTRLLLLAVGNGILGYHVASYLDFRGLIDITAQLERLILFTYPFFVVLIGAAFFGHKLTRTTVPALLIAYAGIAIVFMQSLAIEAAENLLRGSLLVLGAALAFSLFQLFGRELVTRIGVTLYTSIAMTAASASVLAQFFVTQPVSALSVTPTVLWLAVAIALLSTIFPSYLLSFALQRIGAGRTAIVGNAGPLFTIGLAALILGEPFGVIEATGAALVIAGMVLFSRR